MCLCWMSVLCLLIFFDCIACPGYECCVPCFGRHLYLLAEWTVPLGRRSQSIRWHSWTCMCWTWQRFRDHWPMCSSAGFSRKYLLWHVFSKWRCDMRHYFDLKLTYFFEVPYMYSIPHATKRKCWCLFCVLWNFKWQLSLYGLVSTVFTSCWWCDLLYTCIEQKKGTNTYLWVIVLCFRPLLGSSFDFGQWSPSLLGCLHSAFSVIFTYFEFVLCSWAPF